MRTKWKHILCFFKCPPAQSLYLSIWRFEIVVYIIVLAQNLWQHQTNQLWLNFLASVKWTFRNIRISLRYTLNLSDFQLGGYKKTDIIMQVNLSLELSGDIKKPCSLFLLFPLEILYTRLMWEYYLMLLHLFDLVWHGLQCQ